MIRLRVWANSRPMGWFGHAAAAYFFEYDEQWLEQPGAFVLAPQFGLRTERFSGDGVRSFFENLLPEGAALDDIITALGQRDPSRFELLGHLGRELPGVLSLLPENELPAGHQTYRPLSSQTLSERIHAGGPLLLSNEQATMSLAGAQEKMGLRLNPKTRALSESVGTSPTTHILKPDTRQARYRPSAINEYACMKLARALKLPVPDVWLLRVPQAAYVVQRYDRLEETGNIVGLHQIDGCQLLGHGPDWKYQRQGGLASLPQLVQVLRRLSVKGSDLLQFQRWVMFNYLIGNADAHAKNLSVLVDDKGYRLAPFYDLLCVRAYGDTGLALYIGDDDRFDAVGVHSWEALCEDCGFSAMETLAGLRKMAEQMPGQWDKLHAHLREAPDTTADEARVLQQMDKVFRTHVANALSMTALR